MSLAPLGRRTVTVTEHRRVGAYDVLAVADDGPLPAAGQFYMLAAGDRWGGGEDERPFLPRALSVLRAARDAHAGDASPICDLAGGTTLQFMLEDVGPGTRRLAELRAGDPLWLTGPFGNGFAPPRQGRRPILVGGGVGAAPLGIWQDELGAATLVLLGFRDAAHAAGAQLLEGARVATDDGSVGHQGPVTDLLLAELGRPASPEGLVTASLARAEVYACGPPPMLEAVRAVCAELGVPAQLALEAGMACGFGACFGCAVPTRHGYVRLCVDGPVLGAEELEAVVHA